MRLTTETETTVPAPEIPGDVDALLAQLPQQQRIAAALFYVEDLSVREVATSMKLSEGAVKYHLHAARDRARRTGGHAMSDDSLGFEPIDDELRRRLGAAGPRPGDPDATLGRCARAYRRAKRRHQLVVAAGSAVAVVAIIGVGAAVLATGGSDPQHVRVPAADSSAPTPTSTTRCRVRSDDTAPTHERRRTRAAADTGGATGRIGIGHRDVDALRSRPRRTPTRRTAAPSPSSSTTARCRSCRRKRRPGTRRSGTTPGPDRVEVRFTNKTTEWRIRVDLVNGELVEETTQH